MIKSLDSNTQHNYEEICKKRQIYGISVIKLNYQYSFRSSTYVKLFMFCQHWPQFSYPSLDHNDLNKISKTRTLNSEYNELIILRNLK